MKVNWHNKQIQLILIAALCVLVVSLGVPYTQSSRYCGSCHYTRTFYRSWVQSNDSAHRHALASITCRSCHPRSIGNLLHDSWAAVTGDYKPRLPSAGLTKKECLGCHESYAALAQRTAHLKINPHQTHLGEEECSHCHKMHDKSPGLKYCTTCHHTGELISCSRCHKGAKSERFKLLL
jgi:hypothetical protein